MFSSTYPIPALARTLYASLAVQAKAPPTADVATRTSLVMWATAWRDLCNPRISGSASQLTLSLMAAHCQQKGLRCIAIRYWQCQLASTLQYCMEVWRVELYLNVTLVDCNHSSNHSCLEWCTAARPPHSQQLTHATVQCSKDGLEGPSIQKHILTYRAWWGR